MTRARRRAAALIGTGALGISCYIALTAPDAVAQSFGYQNLNKVQQRHVSGLLAAELGPRAQPRTATPLKPAVTTPQVPTASGCPATRGNNVKVNVNCLNLTDSDLQGRAQAQNETSIAADPNNAAHLVSSYNDYRRGDGTCGVSYSLNGGKTWADTTTPNGFTRGDFVGAAREYWQSSGDTSVAWDTKGNAYLSCQMFNRGSGTSPNPDQSSAFYVFRSTGSNGASFNFPGRPVTTHNDTAGAGNFLLDKQLLTVDNHKGSPYADRIYVTWTTFAADGTGYIYEAYSSDYGESFSAPVLVSRDSGLCGNNFGFPTPQGRCNENQDSQPFTGADGNLYVTYNNFNNTVTGKDNHNQMLLSRSTNGGRSFSAPVKVGDYNDLPDCDTYQGTGSDPGRACVVEKGSSHNSVFRASNYPIGAVDPTDSSRVVVTYGSYINRDSNESRGGCTPAGFAADGQNLYTGVKTGGCNNDIIYSVSNNSGSSFSGTAIDARQMPVVTTAAGQASTDQYWQASAFASNGTFVTSYYDRSYGKDNSTGYSDITASASHDRVSFAHKRATSSSMPPPTQFAGQFYGDYAGMDVAGNKTYPVWSDSRTVDEFVCPGTGSGSPPTVCAGSAPNAPVANDEDIYTAGLTIP